MKYVFTIYWKSLSFFPFFFFKLIKRVNFLFTSSSLFYNLNHTQQITVAKYLPINNLLIYSDLTKSIYIDDLNSKTNIAKKYLKKP